RIMVTGFVRMIHRAGKPEFYCIGRIGAPAHEIVERKRERYVERVLTPDVACANWEAEHPSEEIHRICESYLRQRFSRGTRILSYPLEHSLTLLIEACKDPAAASVLDQFMRDAEVP